MAAGTPIWKMQGCGNDFILLDNRRGGIPEPNMPELARKICRRRLSVGADGVIFVVDSQNCDFGWRFFNADGSEAEMCGNAARCVARFAFLQGIAGTQMSFETLAGPVGAQVAGRRVKVRMPTPSGLRQDLGLEKQPGWKWMDFIISGVPHTVIAVQDLEAVDVFQQGRAVRYDALFAPQGTNVNFVVQHSENRLSARTYERGVEDETLACGTGAIASALCFASRGRAVSPVSVTTRSGEVLVIHFEKLDNTTFDKVWLEGDTSIIYQGELNAEALESPQ